MRVIVVRVMAIIYCKGESSNGDSSEGESNDSGMITFFLSSLHQIYQRFPGRVGGVRGGGRF